MIIKGSLFTIIGLSFFAAPGIARLHEQKIAAKELPSAMTTRQAKDAICVKESVRIAGVWIGCKATSDIKNEKHLPKQVVLNSKKAKIKSVRRGGFIRVD